MNIKFLLPFAALVAGCCTTSRNCGCPEPADGQPARKCACAPCACPKPCACTAVPKCADPVIGNWSGDLPVNVMPAMSLIFEREADGTPKATILYRWASPELCSDVKICSKGFSCIHPCGQAIEGSVVGDTLYCRIAPYDAKKRAVKGPWMPFTATRNPDVCPKARTQDAVLGEGIDLLKDGLDGWTLMNPKAKNGWSFKDGVLSNKLGLKPDGRWAGGGSNLMSKRADFYDFNLEYDVRVPAKSNSGVYLRGRYECQVVDSYGQKPDRHNMAAYYGRVAPSVSAEKAPGEWQHVSVTLYRRHITVVLNGTTIIDNAPVVGVTGGAIDSSMFKAGPIYLQGDHSDADFRNMILRPAY